MKKIIFICTTALVLFGAGCNRDYDDQVDEQVQVKPQTDAIDVSEIEDERIGFPDLDISIPAHDELVGEIVQFEGEFCGLSQISGIKLCFVDGEYSAANLDWRLWFWGIPEIDPEIDEYKGQWAVWMLKEFGDIDADNLIGDEVFIVTGKYVFDDCTFYDDRDICIPNVEVTNIEIK